MKIYLQSMADDAARGDLPGAWTTFDFESFSAGKRLWEYQQRALRRASVALWKYYEDCADYRGGEAADADLGRKQRFLRWYEDNGLDARPLALPLAANAKGVARLLPEFYDEETLSEGFRAGEPDRLSFAHFVNRMSFWMATGSGKTLVLVKLIEMLDALVRRGEIPPRDILVLAHRDELLQQFAAHVEEFNAAHRGALYIRLRSLRTYAAAKRDTPNLFADGELTVFTYRSDNLSDEQKERIVDFRNYEAGGGWYVLLDEAHKGDKEDSKRQHIYSILSRRGFLFNFSATFTDPRDLAATASNFNLSEFVRSGFGKHIALLRQEIRAFRDAEDFTGAEKQKIVLKSLLLLAYVKQAAERVRAVDPRLYHEPLLVVFVNSVNTEDADLKLFFRELERIAGGDVAAEVWRQAKDELWDELRARPPYIFEEEDGGRLNLDEEMFAAVAPGDVLRRAFNADSTGAIELCERPSNKNELALKSKVSDKPFALIKVGDAAR
ncbi:MAG: DEAD/DEAH box helicase family protein, partial [Acidobacteriota bacterium]|nr:DEAD/DEAH box helicase family protein [Acidobacteriota bacterium]